MGMCQSTKKFKGIRQLDSFDSSPTRKNAQSDKDISPKKRLGGSLGSLGSIQTSTITDQRTPASIELSPEKKRAKFLREINPQNNSSEKSSSINNHETLQYQRSREFRLNPPSEMNESMMKRWHEPAYSPKELFVNVDYDRIFEKK